MRTSKARVFRRIAAVFGVLFFLCGLLYGSYLLFVDPRRGVTREFAEALPLDTPLSAGQARSDLSRLLRLLQERHPACMDGLPEAVAEAYDTQTGLLSPNPTVLELWRAAAAVLAPLHDAHTSVRYISSDPRRLPLEFSMEEDELTARLTDGTQARVTAVQGQPVSELYADFLTRFSYEQEHYARYQFTRRLTYAAQLAFMGVDVSGPVTLRLEDAAGTREQSIALTSSAESAAAEPSVSYRLDTARSLGILRLSSCDYDETYRRTVEEFFTAVREQGLRAVAVDLRGNGGGSSMVVNEFFRYLPAANYRIYGGLDVRYGPFLHHTGEELQTNPRAEALTFDGAVYALTSINTFSAALDFACALQDNGLGRVVGEIPGGMPASYGDVLTFQLPESRLVFAVSYKYFYRADANKSGEPLIPDRIVPAGEALDALLAWLEE